MSSNYINPILPGFNPDPSIIRTGSDFFLETSSFEYFPGIPIYHSTDLISWRLIGHALTRRSQLDVRTPEPGGGIWAATIRQYDGTFYIMASCYDRYRPQVDDRVWPRGFYVKTDDIWKEEWSEPVFFDQVGFDQDLFWDDDGTVYLSTTYRKHTRTPVHPPIKDFAIHICTINLSTGSCTSQPQLIRESSSGVAEGSHILKRGKYYYLFTAEGGTESGHCEWVSRSEKGPFGPWGLGKKNPLWRNGMEDEVQNTGHADFVEDENGRWWAVFLGVRPVKINNEWKTSVFGRESFLVPMTWEDDWPVVNGGKKVTLQSEGPGLYLKHHDVVWRDDFQEPELSLGWYRKNTPTKVDFSLTERPGYLRLYGSPYTLNIPTCPTLFLRKQSSRVVSWETQLSFKPDSPRTEAGTVVWWNYFTYSSIGIRMSKNDGSKRILLFRPPQGDEVTVDLQSVSNNVKFVVKCEESKYRFGYAELRKEGEEEEAEDGAAQPDLQWIGEVGIDIMTADPPVGAPFTGMMLGLYAFGELEGCLRPADFKYARLS